jgi:dsRNA-specific ribonuclease
VADVLEATIAVTYLDGGHASAVQLCKTYFPRNIWTTPEQQANRLASRAGEYDIHLERLEDLIGYSFKKPSLLLEAMTTGAYKGGDKGARSYERLEFLGDAILDYLVIEHIYRFEGRNLPHHAMHSIKTATVNSWILGFLCMEHFSVESREDIVMKKKSPNTWSVPDIEASQVKKHIWQFIRPGSRSENELRSLEKFKTMHAEIRRALGTGNKYPWPLLCQFNPSKIFSDVIESILGAMYVDSHANNDVCNAFLGRIGLYKILDRLLKDNVACMHPKELLGIAADRRKVAYVYGEKDKMITCHVLIDGKQIGEKEIGEVREIAATIAAEKAVELEQQGMLYDMVEKAWKVVVEDKPATVLMNGNAIEGAQVSFMDIDDVRNDGDDDNNDDASGVPEETKRDSKLFTDKMSFG